MKPTFVGLGAQKCASTWLHRMLSAHPAVAVPAVKEVNFFSDRFDHGYQWYERQFAVDNQESCAGEVSPSYFHHPCAPSRVRRYNPDMKILVTLREPLERAISNHRHEVRLGHIEGPDFSFESGLANNPMYLEQSLYAKHLSHWLKYFPKEQLHVVLVDDIRTDPAGVTRELFRFVGVDEQFEPSSLSTHFNPSYANRSQGLVRLKDHMYRLSQSPGMGWLWSAAAGVGARDLYRRINVTFSDALIPPVRPETIAELRRLLTADVRKLECLLGRELSRWLEPEEVVPVEQPIRGIGE
jgi:hypothetical protein